MGKRNGESPLHEGDTEGPLAFPHLLQVGKRKKEARRPSFPGPPQAAPTRPGDPCSQRCGLSPPSARSRTGQSPPCRAALPAPALPHHFQSDPHRETTVTLQRPTTTPAMGIHIGIRASNTPQSLPSLYLSDRVSYLGVGGGREVVSLSIVLTLSGSPEQQRAVLPFLFFPIYCS